VAALAAGAADASRGGGGERVDSGRALARPLREGCGGGARGLYDAYAGPKRFEELRARNPEYHLLLDRDRGAQATVLGAIHGWLARSPGPDLASRGTGGVAAR
jgi:hypothetical protein